MTPEQQIKLEAATFRRLLKHLDSRKDVQNIDLMNIAGFCRNCLSRWMMEEATQIDPELDETQARARVYGMPYDKWKEQYQIPATPEQLAAFNANKKE